MAALLSACQIARRPPRIMSEFSMSYLMWRFAALLIDHYVPAPRGPAVWTLLKIVSRSVV